MNCSCKICGSYLRPDVVWFGESIKQEIWKEAVKQSMTSDVMIIVGTSLVVSPANTLHFYAKNNQAAIVDINPENTPFSCEMDFSIRQTAVEGLNSGYGVFGHPYFKYYDPRLV